MLSGNSTLNNETIEMYPVGHGVESKTQSTIFNDKPFTFLGKPNEIKIKLVDTQGIDDSSGDQVDNEHIKNMVSVIRRLKQIDLFLLCLEETNPRFTGSIQNTISYFDNIFPHFFQHTVVIFNKSTSPNLEMKQNIKLSIQTIMNEKYKIDNLACFFIDSYYNIKMDRYNDDGTISNRYLNEKIQSITHEQVMALKECLIRKETRCDVINIEPKSTVISGLLKDLEDERLKLIQKEKDLEEERQKRIQIEKEFKLRKEQEEKELKDKLEKQLKEKQELELKQKLENEKKEEIIKRNEKKLKKMKKFGKIVGGTGGVGTTAAIIIALIILL
jgi:hypothetical protein